MRPEDLAEQLANEGGFSISAAGRPAHSGVMVSRSGAEETISGVASAGQIADYQQRHAAEFGRRGYYHGAWLEDTEGGGKQTVQDVSQRFPNQISAQLQGAIHNQRALYDVGKGTYPEVDPILPFPDIGRFDIEEVHVPHIRHRSELSGVNRQAPMEQPELPLR